MFRKRITQKFIIAAFFLITAGCCLALVMSTDRGTWPDTWPKELDALRESSRTLDWACGNQEVSYEIPFDNREDFEAAWPHILKLNDKGSSLILVKSPSKGLNVSMDAGVRIHAPLTNAAIETREGESLKVGPPWPKDIKTESGSLPAYVTNKDGKWVRATDEEGFLYRARIDIELIVDGEIVDLNRILLPPDTSIIDRRFEKRN